MTDTDRIAGIRARADAATPGPWYQGRHRQFESPGEAWTREDMHAPDSYDLFPISARDEDAEFIAAARTDVPFLLDQLAAAEQERDLARASFDDEHEECERAIGRAMAAEAKIAQVRRLRVEATFTEMNSQDAGFVYSSSGVDEMLDDLDAILSASPVSALDAVRADAPRVTYDDVAGC